MVSQYLQQTQTPSASAQMANHRCAASNSQTIRNEHALRTRLQRRRFSCRTRCASAAHIAQFAAPRLTSASSAKSPWTFTQRPQPWTRAIHFCQRSQQRGERRRVRKFLRVSVHAQRCVEQNFQHRTDLNAMTTQHQLIAARKYAPIQMTQIIARQIRTMIVKFHARAGSAAQPRASTMTAPTRVQSQSQTLRRSGDGGFIPGGHLAFPLSIADQP